MLLLNLIPLIKVTFSTPTPGFDNRRSDIIRYGFRISDGCIQTLFNQVR
jgi:hypothetical protein